jgi:hypothetical protein
MKEQSVKEQPPKKSIFDSMVGTISGLFNTNNNNNNNSSNNNSHTHNTNNNTARNRVHSVPSSLTTTTTTITTTTNKSPKSSPKYQRKSYDSKSTASERYDAKLKMCLDCGEVRTDIPAGSDVCAACKSGTPSSTSSDIKELIEFVEEMGFERPVILAAITKLQLENHPMINTESVIGAIGELLAPVEGEDSPPPPVSPPTHTLRPVYSPPPHLPTHVPPQTVYSPPPSYAIPSAPPLHTQDSPGSDLDRTKCKICYENEINTVLLPCAHRVVCLACSTPLHSCPICRVLISQVIKTYDT